MMSAIQNGTNSNVLGPARQQQNFITQRRTKSSEFVLRRKMTKINPALKNLMQDGLEKLCQKTLP